MVGARPRGTRPAPVVLSQPLGIIVTVARRIYTDDEKHRALELYVEHGLAEAVAQTGIPKGTVSSWVERTGLQTHADEQTAAAIEASKLRWEERRLDLAHEMGRVAELALKVAGEQLEAGKPRDAQAAATTMAILADKAQLLTGGSTSRGELTGQRQEVIDAARHGALRLVG